jgi:hypothetical protein
MFRKFIVILLIALLATSSVNAGNVCIDGYGGQIFEFTIKDLTTGELLWNKQVAAGDSHNKNIDDNHKLHQILIQCEFFTSYNPDTITVIENVYNGNWINLYAEGFLRFSALDKSRINRLTVEYGNDWKGNVYNSAFVLPA